MKLLASPFVVYFVLCVFHYLGQPFKGGGFVVVVGRLKEVLPSFSEVMHVYHL